MGRPLVAATDGTRRAGGAAGVPADCDRGRVNQSERNRRTFRRGKIDWAGLSWPQGRRMRSRGGGIYCRPVEHKESRSRAEWSRRRGKAKTRKLVQKRQSSMLARRLRSAIG